MDEGSSVAEATLSEEAPGTGLREGGGAPSLGILEDMLRKSPNTGISLHRSPLPSEGKCSWSSLDRAALRCHLPYVGS
jgi:hypothetical protein